MGGSEARAGDGSTHLGRPESDSGPRRAGTGPNRPPPRSAEAFEKARRGDLRVYRNLVWQLLSSPLLLRLALPPIADGSSGSALAVGAPGSE